MFPPPLAIPPQMTGKTAAALNFLAVHSGLLTCALFLLAGLALAGDYGVNYDEYDQRQIARGNLNYILGRADHIATSHYHDRVYSAVIELPLLLAEQAAGLSDPHYINRLRLTLIHLVFILGAFFCYRLTWHLSGSRLIALLALLIYLLHPRLYAHSFFNSKDLPFLSMLTIALYLLERAFRRDTMGAFLLLGIGVGLLVNLRIMGAMLFPALIAMRGLDWFYAGNGPERKRILVTAGLFVLTAGLTVYALAPYAWTNPLDYLLTNLALTVNHPAVWPQLFQGEWRLSDALPPHYNAVWFAITTPPLILLLGLVGMAAIAAQGFRRPGAAFRNTRLRFLLLLAAVFLLPALAASLLGSVQYDNWRHLYFIYAPFALLAALGGGGLAAALSRRRRWRAGVYGLAAAGLGLILLQMAQLHPLQYDYFNFLVDRNTPDYLRTQYGMDQWRFAHRAGLEYLLKRHPGETLAVRVAEQRPLLTLPPAARQRLRLDRYARHADYALNSVIDRSQPDLAFNSLYRRPYNNTLTDLRPLTAARMEPAAAAAYRELYRQAVAGEPIIRADYNVYRNGNRLTFVKENCSPEEPDAWFGVRLFPHRPETLPPPLRRRGSYAPFENYGVRLGRLCLAFIQLPADAGGDLILQRRYQGNYGAAGAPWWAELYSLSRPGLGELIAEYRRKAAAAALPSVHPSTEFRMNGGGAAVGAFAVFSDREDGRNRLLYAKEDCAQDEYETPVTLHIYPENRADLPFYLWQDGFDNRDFDLWSYGGRPGGECIAVVPLPDYPIAALRTGQDNRWEVSLYPSTEPDRLRETYAALSDRQPDRRAAFDLYWQGNRLVYLRETCAAGDTAADFFLHIIPVDAADLPAEWRDAGFANRDFVFDRWGGLFDGKCLASVPLPDYAIAAVRTGQYVPGQGELWAVELAGGQ